MLLTIFVEIVIHYHSKVWGKQDKKKRLMLLFSKDALNWSKVTVKTFVMFKKIPFNKCWKCSFEPSKKCFFNIENNYYYTIITIIINNLASIIIDNNWATKQHIRMISEAACDTEDWRNCCWLWHDRIKLYFKIYSNRIIMYFKSIIFHNITVFAVFLIK